jgi:hypothetical protein
MACTGELTSPTEPLRLLASSLPAVYIGEPVDLPLRPTGGLRPYTYTVVDGRLPPGLSVTGGRVAGTPTAEGRFAFTVEVSDASLNRTVQRFEMLVRPLPEPVIRVDVPATDVQREAALTLRVEAARGWRGAKVEITWDADAFALDPDSVGPTSASVAALWEHEPGRLRVDVAVLGDPLDGERDLARFALAPTEPGPLRLTVTSEHRYAGGHHHATRHEGAPAATAPTDRSDQVPLAPQDDVDDFDDPDDLGPPADDDQLDDDQLDETEEEEP